MAEETKRIKKIISILGKVSFEEAKDLQTAVYQAFLILQVFQELKLDELAEKLHVDRDKFEKALRKVGNFRIRKVKGEKIVYLQYTGLPSENLYHQHAILWSLKEPEKVKGGNELFRKLLSVDGERRVATFIYRFPDGKILAIERRNLEGKPGLYAFLPLRREQASLTEYEGKIAITVNLSDPEIMRGFLVLEELLGVREEWEFYGVYFVSFSNDFLKEAENAGGLVIREVGEISK